jgi:porphobilinogen deaminase
VRAERRFLELVDAGCDAVVGAFASPLPDGRLELVALLENAGRPARTTVCGADPEALAGEAFEILAGHEARP